MSGRNHIHFACLAIGLQVILAPKNAMAAVNLIAVPMTTGTFCGRPVSTYGNTVYHVDNPAMPAIGGSGDDIIIGTPNADTIRGLAGDDCIFGMDGDDHIEGDGGNDVIYGGRGDDRVSGNPNADILFGDAGNDVLNGGNGNQDICHTDSEDDLPSRCETVEVRQHATIVAAGDIACNPFASQGIVKDYFNGGYSLTSPTCRQGFVSAIAMALEPDAFLGVGDYQYYRWDVEESYALSYDPSWGRLYDISFPTRGNHEKYPYYVAYFSERFDAIESIAENVDGSVDGGTYSFDIDGWHIVAINGAPLDWLENDLAATTAHCILAYQHFPVSSSGDNGDNDIYLPEDAGKIWDILYRYGVTLVVSGDDHDYERFQPQRTVKDISGTKPDEPWKTEIASDGVVQFVVGTGGANANGQRIPHPHTALDESGNRIMTWTHLGFLELELGEESVDFRYVTYRPNPAGNTEMMPLSGFLVELDGRQIHQPAGVEIWDQGTIACDGRPAGSSPTQ
jgi:Calcineurin-like phosphoesterase/RTX calcium-binding nonapeptide repeat (4 copies)